MTDTVQRCTDEQAAAIVTNGHTLLEANAGTGKTTTVVWKVLWHLGLANLVREDGTPLPPCPDERRLTLDRIAAITFTEKAAYDLKRKLRREIARAAPHLLWEIDRAALGTIHSFSGELLREHALRFGIDPGFGVLDERESRLELEEIAREVFHRGLNEGDGSAARLLTEFSLDGFQYQNGVFGHVADVVRDFRWHRERYRDWMEQGRLHRDLLERVAGCWDGKDDPSLETAQALLDVARRTLEEWEEYLERENVRDFDALILDCRDRLLSPEGAHALTGIRERFGLFIIDEFQDTDGAQRDIAFAIAGIGMDGPAAPAGRAGRAGPQLFMVGDPKQSIYRFRGADIAVWNAVSEQVGTPLTLSRNFRSDPLIVDYVNRACRSTMTETGKAVDQSVPESRVEYRDLVAGRRAAGTAGMEWLDVSGKAEERRDLEAEMVAARIRDMVVDRARGDLEGIRITDPDTGLPRDCEYRDVAILVRARTGVECYSQALARYGVPFYLAGDAGLTGQLEILDLLNLLQLLVNPQDDLAALAWLRSPFVGLRDETLARIRLRNSRRPLLWQAADFAESGEWFPAPEHPDIAALEASALRDGIRLIRHLIALRSRVPLDQLAREALEGSGYPLHLLLLPRPEPRLANLQRFLRVLADYRTHTVGKFSRTLGAVEGQGPGHPPGAALQPEGQRRHDQHGARRQGAGVAGGVPAGPGRNAERPHVEHVLVGPDDGPRVRAIAEGAGQAHRGPVRTEPGGVPGRGVPRLLRGCRPAPVTGWCFQGRTKSRRDTPTGPGAGWMTPSP